MIHDRRRPLHNHLLEPFIRKLIEHATHNILYQSPDRKTNTRLQQEVNNRQTQMYYIIPKEKECCQRTNVFVKYNENPTNRMVTPLTL